MGKTPLLQRYQNRKSDHRLIMEAALMISNLLPLPSTSVVEDNIIDDDEDDDNNGDDSVENENVKNSISDMEFTSIMQQCQAFFEENDNEKLLLSYFILYKFGLL
jgi:hypothetical protein